MKKEIFKWIAIATLLLLPAGLRAQSIRQLWIQMPDTLAPYLNERLRTEVADYVEMGEEPIVQNLLRDTTRVVALTSSYLDVKLNAATRVQMRLLPREEEGDTILCVVRTFYGPAAESELSFYDRSWQRLSGTFMRPIVASKLVHQPDSISDERFHEMLTWLDPKLTEIQLSPDDRSLTFSRSLPLMTKEEEDEIKPLLVQIKLNWNGRRFN